MSARSRIEWTDATWNPLVAYRGDKRGWHCEKISPACDHCYAASMNKRSDGLVGIGTGLNYAPDSRAKLRFEIDEKTLRAPEKWRRPRRVFPCSMTDIFGGWHSDEQLDRVFAEMALCRDHTFQVLTKRIDRAHQYLSTPDRAERIGRVFGVWPLPNVWLGVTAENQARAEERIPLLLRTPAAVRFLSAEPLLGPIDLRRFFDAEAKTAGGNGIPRGGDGSIFSAPGRDDLETCQPERRSLEAGNIQDTVASRETSREKCRQVSAGLRDAEREEILHDGSSTRLEILQRPDSERFDDKPQEWERQGQSPRKSGTCDGFPAAASRDRGVGAQKEAEPNRAICWVITGGESGPGARPSHPDWFRSLRDQCVAAGVPFFHKQNGEWAFSLTDVSARPSSVHEFPDGTLMERVGKRAADRLLDGVEWSQFPEVRRG